MGGGRGLMKENLSGRLRVEPDQVLGYSGLKLTKLKANSQHKSYSAHTHTQSQLLVDQVFNKPQAAHKARLWAWEKQPTKEETIQFDYEI